MKKSVLIISIVVAFALSGCSTANSSTVEPSSSLSQSSSSSTPTQVKTTDEDILKLISPYMENAEIQDISTEETFSANMGMEIKSFTSPVLYMGMPNSNTTYFFMATLNEGADKTAISTKLNDILTGWVNTSKQGYIQGWTEFEIIEKDERIFAVMHEDQIKYNEILEIIKTIK